MKLYKIKFKIGEAIHEGVIFADDAESAKESAVLQFPLYTLENIVYCEDQSLPV